MDKVYLIGARGTHNAFEITLSLPTAQEMIMSYAYANGCYVYNLYRYHGYKHAFAMRKAKNAMDKWYIWEKDLI